VDINQPVDTSSKLTDVRSKKRQIDADINQPADTSNELMDEVPSQLKKRRVLKINVFSNNTKLLLPVETFSSDITQLNVGCYYFIN
jgi:RNA-binding protein YhbY